jgi:hypothetical protein
MPTSNSRTILNSSIPNDHFRKHCTARITTIGRKQGQQVRVERCAPDGAMLLDFALYTGIDLHDKEPDSVFLGYWEPEYAEYEGCSEGFNGTNPRTLVNHLSANDVHLEQSHDSRTRYGMQTAKAVAEVIDTKTKGVNL